MRDYELINEIKEMIESEFNYGKFNIFHQKINGKFNSELLSSNLPNVFNKVKCLSENNNYHFRICIELNLSKINSIYIAILRDVELEILDENILFLNPFENIKKLKFFELDSLFDNDLSKLIYFYNSKSILTHN